MIFVVLCFTHIYADQLDTLPLVTINSMNEKAIAYVGNTYAQNGTAQLKLLVAEGLMPEHYVFEVGCGALVAGIPLMSYLQPGHFVGVDPNKWLIDASLAVQENKYIVDQAQPLFLYNYNFDGSEANIAFDYILSHSIISHAPLWQLKLFLKNCAQVLKKGGKVLFSLRLTDANPYDGLGIKQESTTHEWQYPGNTFFHKQTVIDLARQWFSEVTHKPEYQAIIMASDSTAFHDWFVATK